MTKIDGGLRQIFRDKLRGFHMQSIESHITGRGTPDTNYCSNGVEGWIEFKQTTTNKIRSIKPEQVAWCEKRLRYGGRVFFAVRYKKGGVGEGFDDVLWLIRGEGIRDLYLEGLSSLLPNQISGRWPGGPRGWPWERISQVLAPK